MLVSAHGTLDLSACCTATNILWMKYSLELGPADYVFKRLPKSLTNLKERGPEAPRVSYATGVKVWLGGRLAYFCSFLTLAKAATSPAPCVA